jgi:DNA-binding response OmpR family regulator
MSKLLLVDDDRSMIANVMDWLKPEHHTFETAYSGQEAVDKLLSFDYDLVILDWELPEMSGVEICKLFREKRKMTPVLMLTGKTAINDKESGFDAGADDYLTKPFHPKELIARVRALLRRPTVISSPLLQKGSIVVDRVKRKVTRQDQDVALQPMEFSLLEFFLKHPDQLFSTDALLRRCWSDDTEISPDAIYTCIRRLRKKLDVEGEPSIIRTVHSVGYVLDSDS